MKDEISMQNISCIEISTFKALLRKNTSISWRVQLHPNVVESESLQVFRGCDCVMLHIKEIVWLFFWEHAANKVFRLPQNINDGQDNNSKFFVPKHRQRRG